MHKTTMAVAIAAALASCSAPSSLATATDADPVPATSEHISGRVIDADGMPVKAHIALVTKNGSRSMGSGNGTFHFNGLRADEYVLTAWTDDGRWTRLARVAAGSVGLELMPDQPGAYVDVTMTGRQTARLAVSHDGLRFADRTLRDGTPMRFLVPAGDTSYRLYGADLERTLDLRLAPGESEAVDFALSR